MTMVTKGRNYHFTYVMKYNLKSQKGVQNTIRRLAKVAEAAWTGAPTVILNKPSKSGAGAGSENIGH